MKEYTVESPEYKDKIMITEPTDPAHADNINNAPKQLLNNDLVLKALIDALQKQLDGTTKADIGLGNVDDTSDDDKPVSTLQRQAIEDALQDAKDYADGAYQQSTGYTDKKVADLIGGAPETLDTLKEIADEIAKDKGVVDALDAAIGKKANQAELDTHTGNGTIHVTQAERNNWNNKQEKNGDSADNTVTFTSGDTSNATGWKDVAVLASKETHKSLLNKISTAIANLRYIWKLIGTTDISKIGGGTITGAISALNTGLTSFTPTIKGGGSGGTVTVSSISGKYKVFGNMLFLQYQFNGNANGWLDLYLPGSYKATSHNTLAYYCNTPGLDSVYITSGKSNII